MAWRIGIDIGGTFTDVALVDDASGHVGVAKVSTTPGDLTEELITPRVATEAGISSEQGSAGLAPSAAPSRRSTRGTGPMVSSTAERIPDGRGRAYESIPGTTHEVRTSHRRAKTSAWGSSAAV